MPTTEEIRAHRATTGLNQADYGALAELGIDQIKSAESGRGKLSGAAWTLLRARSALLRGDTAQALAVLKETLPASA